VDPELPLGKDAVDIAEVEPSSDDGADRVHVTVDALLCSWRYPEGTYQLVEDDEEVNISWWKMMRKCMELLHKQRC
jgi:hypothetical protein